MCYEKYFGFFSSDQAQDLLQGGELVTWLATCILGELTHIKRCYCLRIHVVDKCSQQHTTEDQEKKSRSSRTALEKIEELPVISNVKKEVKQ